MNSLTTDFQNRLVPLSDGRPGLRGSLHIEARTPTAAELSPSPLGEGRGEGNSPAPPIRDNSCNSCTGPCLDFVSSDNTLDRYREIITPAGWHLAAYQRNPVFQNSHQYGDIIFTLGRALITEIRPGGPSSGGTSSTSPHLSASPHLFQRVEFATDVNPMARIAYGLYSGKFLNAVSVGFIPIRWENGDVSPRPSDGRGAGGEGFARKYLEQELLEVSAVAIPANPNALALAYKSGAVEKSDLRDTLDLLRHALAISKPAASSPSPWGPRSAERSPDLGQQTCGGLGKPLGRGEGELHSPLRIPHSALQLARELRNLLCHT